MGSEGKIQSGYGKTSKALKWVCETLQLYPDKTRKELIIEAELRFDLTPVECEFLDKNFTDCSKTG